jgi:hypothetical protein
LLSHIPESFPAAQSHFAILYGTDPRPSILSIAAASLTRYGVWKSTAANLVAHAAANSYKREAHKEHDEIRHCEKHVKRTKRDQDATSERYVMWVRKSSLRPIDAFIFFCPAAD